MGPGTLSQILHDLPPFSHPDLLVDTTGMEDAGVFRIHPQLALVQTVDFFAPMVDDPRLFGAVAAANALSDVYAMGGRPLTCLNIAAFPTCSLPAEALRAILLGGAEKVREAGAVMLGGHTIEDEEVKYGLAVTGIIHPDQVVTNAGARPGDYLILTKPLGIGVITTAIKGNLASPEAVRAAAQVMTTLNRQAAQAMAAVGVHGCTDITGFGLLGHAHEMASASGVALELDAGAVPVIPQALPLAVQGVFPGGARRNREYLEGAVGWAQGMEPWEENLLVDPQTSGGLLIALPEDQVSPFQFHLGPSVEGAVIGRVVKDNPGRVLVKGRIKQ